MKSVRGAVMLRTSCKRLSMIIPVIALAVFLTNTAPHA